MYDYIELDENENLEDAHTRTHMYRMQDISNEFRDSKKRSTR